MRQRSPLQLAGTRGPRIDTCVFKSKMCSIKLTKRPSQEMSTKSLLELSTSPKPWFCTVMLPSCNVSAATVPATCMQSTRISF